MEDISKIQLKDALGNAVSYNIKDAAAREHLLYIFDTVADMKSATNLENNTLAKTRGFTEIGKGAGYYYITNEVQTVDNIRIFSLQNSLYAILLDNGDISSYGADDTGVTDCTNILKVAIANNNILNLEKEGIYLVSSEITIPSNFTLNGNSATIKTNNSSLYMISATNQKNINFNNLFFENAHRCISFINCNNISLNNIHITSNEWAILFRLCKNVTSKNLFFKQPVPAGTSYNNTDGIHINGLINGLFENVFGFTGDDFIALNADESNQNYGTIENVRFINCRNDLNTSLELGTNNAYRCIRFLAVNSLIRNITFENCCFRNATEEVIIASGNTNQQLIDNVKFINCSFYGNVNNKNLFNSSSYIGTFEFLNCYVENTSNSSMFNINATFNTLIMNNCKINNLTSATIYLLNFNAQVTNCFLKNINVINANALNLLIQRTSTLANLIIDTIKMLSSTNWLVQTYSSADILNIILNNIPKTNNTGLIYFNTSSEAIVQASNVDTQILTVSNANFNRLIGGVSDRTPVAPQNGDMYLLKSGNTYTQKIYSNGSWQ